MNIVEETEMMIKILDDIVLVVTEPYLVPSKNFNESLNGPETFVTNAKVNQALVRIKKSLKLLKKNRKENNV